MASGGGSARVAPLPAAGARKFEREASQYFVWDEFGKGSYWFRNLRIAHDGGFNEVHVLFTPDRFLWALVCLAFLAMNLWVLFYPNIYHLTNDRFLTEVEESHGFLINYVLQSLFGSGITPTILLAILELALLAVLLMRACIWAHMALTGDPAHKWHAIASGFWHVIPHLMTFSAMRLLNFVAPSVLVPALSTELFAGRRRQWNRCGLPLLHFIFLRSLCAIVGFEAFMVKFLDTAQSVLTNQDTGWRAILLGVAFLNQILGIVQVAPLLQQRLFVYIFGGEDSFINDREQAVQKVWCARLAKRIWEEAKRSHTPSTLWFFAVMLSYSDMDFQRLTLNERDKGIREAACGTDVPGDEENCTDVTDAVEEIKFT